MTSGPKPVALAVEVARVSHAYGNRLVLDEVSLAVPSGTIFGLLGPNGGGKTTLFRLLATLIPLQQGSVRLLNRSLTAELEAIRRELGVVFQSPSLDKKLSAAENLRHQGHLYGLRGPQLQERLDEMLRRVGLTDRARERVENLSGGLQRRVELAKAFLHRPRLLLLDEPSTGLDPVARRDLWAYLRELQSTEGVTVLVTTHAIEEAERSDLLGILDRGRLLALDSPENLRARVGGEVLAIRARDPEAVGLAIQRKFSVATTLIEGEIRLEHPAAHGWVPQIVAEFGNRIESINLARPSLEDVFIQLTGHRLGRAETAKEHP